jgi:uncharacterized protein (DUF1330 family)
LVAALLASSACAPIPEEEGQSKSLSPPGDPSLGPLIELETFGPDGATVAAIKVPNVAAAEIAAAFDANEVAAFQKYGGQMIAVSGTVEEISLDMADDPVVSFAAGDYPSFNAMFDKERGAATARLRKGQIAAVACGDIREFAGSPSLNDCWLLDETAVAAAAAR